MSNLLPNTYLGTRVSTGTGEGNTYLFIWGLRDLTVWPRCILASNRVLVVNRCCTPKKSLTCRCRVQGASAGFRCTSSELAVEESADGWAG